MKKKKLLEAFTLLDDKYIEEAAPKIKEAILSHPEYPLGRLSVIEAPDFAEAVAAARNAASVGDRVLLSPACTSFDIFNNFEERGNRFKNIVNGFQSDKN